MAPGNRLSRRFYSCTDILGRWALIGAGQGSVRGIHHHEFTHNPIGPAKAVLKGIFAPAALTVGGDHVVLLDQLPASPVDTFDVQHPATVDALGHPTLALAFEPFVGDCPQRRPSL